MGIKGSEVQSGKLMKPKIRIGPRISQSKIKTSIPKEGLKVSERSGEFRKS